ncbi:unnamed protein product [Phytophthora fragariaefolia]|uniref:Unnamed protein product n=1 Tax=Phytophthora fragariaefolia TaxID=1490495 RepID=A0A9W6X998_9STRA|nr:unnamed protein product [Phytophthora fragariaefolia]
MEMKARKAAQQATSAVANRSGPPQSVPSPPLATSVSASSAPVAGITVSADSDVLSFVSVPSGPNPPFSPIPRTPTSPASSTTSTTSLPNPPVASSGVTPGTEVSVPAEVDGDGGAGDDEAASKSSVPLGGVF